jgi:hypothetical protein
MVRRRRRRLRVLWSSCCCSASSRNPNIDDSLPRQHQANDRGQDDANNDVLSRNAAARDCRDDNVGISIDSDNDDNDNQIDIDYGRLALQAGNSESHNHTPRKEGHGEGKCAGENDRNASDDASLLPAYSSECESVASSFADERADPAAQLGQDIVGREIDAYAGLVISLSGAGTRLAVSSEEGTDNSGQVRLFEYDSFAGTWAQSREYINGQPGDKLGRPQFSRDGTVAGADKKLEIGDVMMCVCACVCFSL